jgi:hypothetical protein
MACRTGGGSARCRSLQLQEQAAAIARAMPDTRMVQENLAAISAAARTTQFRDWVPSTEGTDRKAGSTLDAIHQTLDTIVELLAANLEASARASDVVEPAGQKNDDSAVRYTAYLTAVLAGFTLILIILTAALLGVALTPGKGP